MTRNVESETTQGVRMDSPGLRELVQMLSLARPHDSNEDSAFCRQWLAPLGAKPDAFGNYMLRVGESPILFSSHTDTVASQGGVQTLHVTPKRVQLSKRERKRQRCLGADCTAGVWIMREMILARVPGFYVFHRGEEGGGLGSSYIASKTPDKIEGLQAAIAFDRRGTHSVITHQAGGRCCSETFSDSLSSVLGLGHSSDSGGSFTDSANYTDLIGECTNLSVGYSSEHSPQESLDLPYLFALRDSLVAADWSQLVYERKPGEVDPYDYDWRSYSYTSATKRGYLVESRDAESDYDEALFQLVRWNPEIICDLLETYGLDALEVADFVYERGGAVPMAMLDSESGGRKESSLAERASVAWSSLDETEDSDESFRAAVMRGLDESEE